MADKKENVQLEKTMDKAEQEKLESVKKADAAVKALLEDGFDFVYIHMEAPDEMGHQGSLERKIKAIEYRRYIQFPIARRDLRDICNTFF